MLEATVDRLKRFMSARDIYISTRESFRSKVMHLITDLPENNLLLEPMPKDTAAAICLSSFEVEAEKDDVLFFLPSDHYIRDDGAFERTVTYAAKAALERRKVILLGVEPTYASSAYGYLDLGRDKAGEDALLSLSQVKRFHRKTEGSRRRTVCGCRALPMECRDVFHQAGHNASFISLACSRSLGKGAKIPPL